MTVEELKKHLGNFPKWFRVRIWTEEGEPPRGYEEDGNQVIWLIPDEIE